MAALSRKEKIPYTRQSIDEDNLSSYQRFKRLHVSMLFQLFPTPSQMLSLAPPSLPSHPPLPPTNPHHPSKPPLHFFPPLTLSNSAFNCLLNSSLVSLSSQLSSHKCCVLSASLPGGTSCSDAGQSEIAKGQRPNENAAQRSGGTMEKCGGKETCHQRGNPQTRRLPPG